MAYESIVVKQAKGGDITFSAVNNKLMINSDSLSCQFPLDRVVPSFSPDGACVVLRLVIQDSPQIGMSLYLRKNAQQPLTDIFLGSMPHLNPKAYV